MSPTATRLVRVERRNENHGKEREKRERKENEEKYTNKIKNIYFIFILVKKY